MQNQKTGVQSLAFSGAVAALYAAITLALPALSYAPAGLVQIRPAEALCVLPFLFPAAAPGLFAGCLIANQLSPYGLLDLVLGSLATLFAALWTMSVRRRWLAPLPPVLANGLIVGGMIAWYEAGFGPAFPAAFALNAVAVALGELLSCYLLGMPLLSALSKAPALRPFLAARHAAPAAPQPEEETT